jgi:hypothetical protein
MPSDGSSVKPLPFFCRPLSPVSSLRKKDGCPLKDVGPNGMEMDSRSSTPKKSKTFFFDVKKMNVFERGKLMGMVLWISWKPFF